MSDKQQHITPLADKLQQVSLPDANASWKGMEVLLDQHMPQKEKKRRFFFILSSILLLLLAGGFYAGYLYKHSHYKPVASTKNPAALISTRDTTSNESTGLHNRWPVQNQQKESSDQRHEVSTGRIISSSPISNKQDDNASRILSKKKTHSTTDKSTSVNKEKASVAESSNAQFITLAKKQKNEPRLITVKKDYMTGAYARDINKRRATVWDASSSGSNSRQKRQPKKLLATEAAIKQNSRPINNTIEEMVNTSPLASGTVRNHVLSLYRPILNPLHQLAGNASLTNIRASALTDSLLEQLKKKKLEEIKKGWTFHIGLNQIFHKDQQWLPYSNGTKSFDGEGVSGTIADYIPVPQVRYHFSNKVYIQGEIQVNAPQFAGNILLNQNSYRQGEYLVNDTVYIKKLSYFNLPLSIHYSPVKNLHIGTGIQYARLTNAFVLYEQSQARLFSPFPDSVYVKTEKTQSLKEDTLYKRLHTNEFRLLGDVNYQVKRFTLGVRYNHALTNFVKVPVTNSGTVTQARNSSLQLYLRYMFLDKRKKIKPRLK